MSARERFLALAFVTVVVAGGAFLAGMYLKQWKDRVDQQEFALEMREAEAEVLLDQQMLWLQRMDWLQQRQQTYGSRKEADLKLLQQVEESGRKFGVEIQQQQPNEPAVAPGMIAARMAVAGRGEFQPVMEWLHGLQQPELCISFSRVSIVPSDEEPTMVNVDVVLERWYREPAESS